jgi:8-oxo-dGTP pyrophosphatase MutT (NUDIX family)
MMFTRHYPEREAVRALLFDEEKNLLLLKRIKTGRPVYYVTPGGKIEEEDASIEAALQRELMEELDAEALIGREVLSLPGQRFHIAKVTYLGPNPFTHGPEFKNTAYGKYELAKIPLSKVISYHFNLQPVIIKTFLKQYHKVIEGELTDMGFNFPTPLLPKPEVEKHTVVSVLNKPIHLPHLPLPGLPVSNDKKQQR